MGGKEGGEGGRKVGRREGGRGKRGWIKEGWVNKFFKVIVRIIYSTGGRSE